MEKEQLLASQQDRRIREGSSATYDSFRSSMWRIDCVVVSVYTTYSLDHSLNHSYLALS